MATCTITDCHRPARSGVNLYCEMHYYRMRRNGTTQLQEPRQPSVKYRAAHCRIAIDRGKADGYCCVDCGGRAQHWSYTNDDPNELASDEGQPYSLDTSRYDPRCVSCHATFDGTGQNQYTGRKRLTT